MTAKAAAGQLVHAKFHRSDRVACSELNVENVADWRHGGHGLLWGRVHRDRVRRGLLMEMAIVDLD